jgi:hypothetical protein
MVSPWLAWPSGSDPAELAARLRSAHRSFLADGGSAPPVRRVVLDSWRRSLHSGVDPDGPGVRALSDGDLRSHRDAHTLAPLMPIVRRLLLDAGECEGLVVAVTDAAGRLLWVEGDRGVRRSVEAAGFVEGASWSEADAGTNAPGTALATDHAVQVFAAEHFAVPVHPWSCSAAPVHDADGQVVGALDITGRDPAAAPHMLSLVRATVAAMESELVMRRLRATARPSTRPRPDGVAPERLEVLGRARAVLTGTLAGTEQPHELSVRHSEILLLLAGHPRGLGADELAVQLHPGRLADVTVRAEVSRLRRVVGPLLGGSRPYRLTRTLPTDLHRVERLLARGDVAAAVHHYDGPVLPRSDAPGVVRLRESLDAEVRAAVAATDDVEAVLTWVHGPGIEDRDAWARLTALAPPDSALRAQAAARLRLVDRDLV